MEDVKRHACGCPDMRSESARDYQGLSPEDAARRLADEQLTSGGLRSGLGGAVHGQPKGVAQMLRAPGKMFSRETIVAILKGHLALATARPPEMNERDAIRALITVFENLE